MLAGSVSSYRSLTRMSLQGQSRHFEDLNETRRQLGGPSIKHHIQAQLDAVAGRPRARPAIRGPARPHFCAVEALPLPAPQRVASVDALRGFTMFWIIGADGATKALAEMLSGKGMIPSTAGKIIDGQFEHAEWEGIALLRPHLPVVHLRDRRRDRVLAHAADRAGEQIHRVLARVAPVAALVRARARIRGRERKLAEQRGERKLAGHPAPQRAQSHRALLFVHVAPVPQPSSAGIDRRIRGDPRGLLGTDDLRASVRDRGGPTRRTRTSPTGSTRNTCPGGNGTAPGIPKV